MSVLPFRRSQRPGYRVCSACGVEKPMRDYSYDEDTDQYPAACTACGGEVPATPPPDTKRCTACGITKSTDDFHRHKGNPDGRAYECKECRKFEERRRYDRINGIEPQRQRAPRKPQVNRDEALMDDVIVQRLIDGFPVTYATLAETEAAFRVLHGRGFSDGQIADKMRVTTRTVLRRRNRYGLPANPDWRLIDTDVLRMHG